MNVDDYLKSLEDGKAQFVFDPAKMQLHILTLAIRNKVYLEHIFTMLYDEEDDRLANAKILDELVEKTLTNAFAEIVSKTK
jgi:hypothetical protein